MARDAGSACEKHGSRVSASQSSFSPRKPTYLEILLSASRQKAPPIKPRPDQTAKTISRAVSQKIAAASATTPDQSAWPPLASVEDNTLQGTVDASGGTDEETRGDADAVRGCPPQSDPIPNQINVDDDREACRAHGKDLSEDAVPVAAVRSQLVDSVNTSPSLTISTIAEPDPIVDPSLTAEFLGTERSPTVGCVSCALEDEEQGFDEDHRSGDTACDQENEVLASRRRRRRRKKRTGVACCAVAGVQGSSLSSSGASFGNRTALIAKFTRVDLLAEFYA
eukprot:TRINITY_DN715_c0_g2_i1.p1 TRINITY_DN715_c0_g2~~TRINITY_DN715_c0_g2_i1.p1  ORF type:complete len:304 (+),score=27.69 TRINITY_DN715_c0_g2_i1:70-912(+)